MDNIIKAKGIKKTYKSGEVETPVLKGIDLEVQRGEFLAIMGRSGAGKSTLLYQLSLLDEPTEGEIEVDGTDILALSNSDKTDFRLQELGYVFQDYALVPELTAVENVSMPILMRGIPFKEAYAKAREILNGLGLDRQVDNLPSQLSGGEQQRVSIARSIVDDPKIIFADEPTANLDMISARAVIDILKELNRKGQTIVMVTHEEEYGQECDRIVRLVDGQIERIDVPNKNKGVI
jgi:putative ABC transport system ATP-binding protein